MSQKPSKSYSGTVTRERQITLKHLYFDNQKMIGLKFYPDKLLQTLIKQLPGVKWSAQYGMAYIPNEGNNIDIIFDTFKAVCWINCHNFFPNKPVFHGDESINVDAYRKRKPRENWRYCPEEFYQKLEIRKYSLSTARSYIGHFELFMNHFSDVQNLMEIGENEIKSYISHLVISKYSEASIKMSINAIKFYYEIVKEMPNRFYSIGQMPRRKVLPKVISKGSVKRMIESASNIKHKCIIEMLYSSGVRRNELINLELSDIDSDRMLILVRQGKGNKDRVTLLGKQMLEDLRAYYVAYRPKKYLFEGPKGGKYSPTSVARVIAKAARSAKINKKVTPHILRHSFATHLLENGTDLRYIQTILGHTSSRTTEIYTNVALKGIEKIQNPLDLT